MVALRGDKGELNSRKTRIYGYDLLRIMLGFLVVVQHFWRQVPEYPLINNIMYVFRNSAVPIFMSLSFYLCYHSLMTMDAGGLKKRLLRLWKPFLFWGLFNFIVLEMIYMICKHTVKFGFLAFALQIIFGDSVVNPPLWFLWDLMVLTAVVWFILRMSSHREIVLVGGWILVSLVVYSRMYFIIFQNRFAAINDIWYISSIKWLIYTMLFAFTGLLLRHYEIPLLYSKLIWWKKLIVDMALVFMIVAIRMAELAGGFNGYYYGFPHQILMVVLAHLIFFFPSDERKNIKPIWERISVISGYTLGTFCSHWIVGEAIRKMEGRIFPDAMGSLFSCLLIYVCSFVFCYVLSIIPVKLLREVCTT